MHRFQRVLLYGINYAPEMLGVGRYSGELGGYLADNGFDVEVVTAAPHYPGWTVSPPYRAFEYRREILDKVRVYRCPILVLSDAHGWKRALIPFVFALLSAPIALWRMVMWRPDTVLVVEPTLFVAPVVLFGAKLCGAKTALHVQDLEIDAAFAMKHLRGKTLYRIAAWFERCVMKRFDKIVTISHEMRTRLILKGIETDRIVVIRNWVNTASIYPMEGPNAYRKELGVSEDAFVALYSGNIGPKQALHVVLNAAERLTGRKNVVFVVAGDGPEKANLVSRFGHLPNVKFLSPQPNEKLCVLLNMANIHILSQDREAAGLVLPSKLGGMLASGRNILATAEEGTELYDFLQGVAVTVPFGDSEKIVECLLACADLERGKPAVSDKHLSMLNAEQNLNQFATQLTDFSHS